MSSIWTIKEARNWAFSFLKIREDLDEPIKEGDYLLCYVMGMDRSKLLAYHEKELTFSEKSLFIELVKKRAQGEPYAYLTNNKEFMGLNLKVTKDVLIPRPETELLVESALNIIKTFSCEQPIKVLDMCTGSGNVGLSIGYYSSKPVKITLLDISSDALQIAKENAHSLGLQSKCTFLESDMFSKVSEKYDIITANPPYISESDYSGLSIDVKNEPVKALKAGSDGLLYYRKIAEEFRNSIVDNGTLLLEVGDNQAQDVSNLFLKKDLTTWIEQDLAGIDRLVGITKI
ncbi:peptide chain release factor N(5)-glutamine methyltransferase [Natranaerobius trueperi]|uniref:Release factor glutamine methyltransferase n=1 Tax=Natranaerobius trueperi TaxID=759412 RepID=A0A226C076_9FIRM|nr:peptide chain release factor N(5)-glutamine methyltransferase [Natranaerobius trueperi]OWZ84581.1 protein-(glutamine-N5) methyltransferase, release factor-specific [Natranaerobius trueperi]